MNVRYLLRWLLGLLLAAGVAPAPAAPAPAGWLPDEALGSLMLRTLVPAADGLLWAGTDDGVYRYDGTRLVPLNALRRGGPALPAVPCNHLLPLPDGQLWLGTEAGLYRLLPGGQLEELPLPDPASSNRLVEALALDAATGRVWVGQSLAGIRAYSPAGRPQGPLLNRGGSVKAIWPAPDGTLWLTSHQQTRQFDTAGRLRGEWCHSPAGLIPLGLTPVYDPAGRPWLLSTQAAYRADPGGSLREVLRWPAPGPELTGVVLRAAAGPTVLTTDRVRELAWTPGPDPTLRQRAATAPPPWQGPTWHGFLLADRAGQWWVFDSGARGCWHRAAARPFIVALPGPGGQPYSVRSSIRLPDGRLLVSTYSGNFTQAADSPLAPLRRWPGAVLPTGEPPVLPGVVPRPLGPRGDWLAAGLFMLLRFDPGSGRFGRLTVQNRLDSPVNVNCLAYDPGSRLAWAGTRLGLVYYAPVRRTFLPYAPPGATTPPLAGRLVEDVCPDGRGHLWLATPEGVERLTLATGARRRYGPSQPAPRRAAVDGARCLYLASDGRLWVGTRAHGLAVVEPDGRIRPALTAGQGLPSAHVATIVPGPGGTLWLGTYQGLVRYQPASGQLAVYTTAHGLAADECNGRAAYVDPADNSLLIGGVGGLNRVWPAQAPGPSARRPRLLLAGLSTLGSTAEASRPRYQLAADPLPALRLTPDAPLVSLHLALTDAPDPGRARYAYRVRGWLGDRWLSLGTTPELRLQGLPPGRHVVEVRAESGQGVPAANVLRLPLTVTAAWYNSPLTWALAALAAVAAVYAWQRGRLRQLRREHELRARLAADLHDEVGALLTRVTMQAELLRELDAAPAPQLTALVEDSRAAASTVRDIIWSVDADADSLAALAARVQDHLDATARATARPLSFDDTALPPVLARPLPPTVRQHAYLIFREALTNALKHSPPGTPIAVALACTDHLLALTVASQTGPAPAARAGQGLRNMRQRAVRLRATLEAGPVATGWLVRLQVPLG